MFSDIVFQHQSQNLINQYLTLSTQAFLINMRPSNRQQPLSDILVHQANIISCADHFGLIFKHQDKKEGVSQTTGSFKNEAGKEYTQTFVEAIFCIGYDGTVTPSGEGTDSKGQCCGMYKQIRTHNHYEKMYEKNENKEEPFKECQRKYQEYKKSPPWRTNAKKNGTVSWNSGKKKGLKEKTHGGHESQVTSNNSMKQAPKTRTSLSIVCPSDFAPKQCQII